MNQGTHLCIKIQIASAMLISTGASGIGVSKFVCSWLHHQWMW